MEHSKPRYQREKDIVSFLDKEDSKRFQTREEKPVKRRLKIIRRIKSHRAVCVVVHVCNPAVGRLRQEDHHEFELRLGYIARL